jgi:hypothetical protein
LGRDGLFPHVQIGFRESSLEIYLRLEP